jgi:SAM-dependent methyltransferase
MGVVAVVRRVGAAVRERGVGPVVADCGAWGGQWVRGRVGRDAGSFTLDGAAVPYFSHPYNWTWLNERAVEVALAERVLAGATGRVLEVGNVLAHYRAVSHDVVDKYERAPGVRNADVLAVTGSYDLIVSVSTLEHVGLDEDVRDPAKPVRAVRALKEALAPGGTLWVTLPVGYNPDLDAAVRSGELAFDRLSALRREPRRNGWRQVPVDEVWEAPYDRLLYTAHGLLVGTISAAPAPARPR